MKKILIGIKQNNIEEFIRKKKIIIENYEGKLTAGYRLQEDDVILIDDDIWNQYQNLEIESIKNLYKPSDAIINLFQKSVLYENKDFLVLNKPSGFACQQGTGVIHSIDNIMRYIYGDEIRIVHRLDKETSGALMMAKNLHYSQLITKFFKEKLVEKKYYAICDDDDVSNEMKSRILQNKKVIINAPLKSKIFSNEEKMSVDFENGDEAISEIQLIKKNHDGLLLLQINPKTGRKHQIRAHLSFIGLPIIGDKKYNKNKSIKYKNLFLHSSEISIKQKELNFSIKCPLPDYFLKF